MYSITDKTSKTPIKVSDNITTPKGLGFILLNIQMRKEGHNRTVLNRRKFVEGWHDHYVTEGGDPARPIEETVEAIAERVVYRSGYSFFNREAIANQNPKGAINDVETLAEIKEGFIFKLTKALR